MARLNILLVAVAGALSLAGCKWNGPHYYDKQQYRNDPSTIARDAGVPPHGGLAGNSEPVPAGINQLLCEHARAVHHPYKYLYSCAQPHAEPVIEITGEDRELLVRN